MALYLRYAVRSDLGLVRNNNEDSVYAGPRLLAIADGMGGHAAGEVASKIVIGTMEPLDEDRRIDDLMGSLRDTVNEANQGIADAVKQRKELEGMGTTLTALRFVGGQVGLVHVGDSRAYLLRNNLLTQITHDDTYVQYLVDSGKLTPDEAKDHPRKSVILRALLGTEVEPDVSIREARHGDRYLLCSDGLSDVVSSETILETLRIPDVQESADRLVELALRGGGPDNVTVIVADVINARVGDVIDDVPVIAGAFVDPAAADVPGDASAAERAAQMARKGAAPPPSEPAEPTRRRRFRWKPWLIGLAVVAVVVAALGGAYAWTQTQYFVGPDGRGSEVAIFRGVNTEFGPLKFFTVYKNTNLEIADLNASVRSQVEGGIAADSIAAAERIVTNLRDNRLPVCVTDTPTPTPTPTPTAKSSVKSSGKSSAAPGRSTAKPRRGAPSGARTTPSAGTTTSAASPAPTASTPRPRPGVDCR
ncbi:protein phosphatase [Jatrophihabitans endophyticus]|uniref:Serine/threonine protein phosphatase PstP n=1 Tax=Jatrophihabitans endophyticus TaxID=1206085 RepID=A0A1M5I715_9ACTN|nr:PP2C family serine/threonine-protein phosphatase [Jatrophihabitans endophyticus]SHG24051.1 protein phosphatase [Jatrophihabitans endophyticus]